ncbi:hypothetical protein JMA_28220 [Jeotgalibacillus malaysiensis]|uniref:DUF8042 domain-containing protein n=1 Tax=Jeotgalibacillus malaysiensis TaxID=1508404 RepID=A0A0B5AVT9_9BACL|nr:hypothetical protein [Jeotgalibacillus malaysiensis]AJD92139.1 hypothetical protein JMA_28220 [Jeotgalibacillus malaysiensis]
MNVENLVGETKQSINELLPSLHYNSELVNSYLRQGNEYKAMNLLPELIDALSWLLSAVEGIEKNGYNIVIDKALLTSILKEALEGLENDDNVLLADVLEYELNPMLEKWIKETL